jgi:hypothetical protein
MARGAVARRPHHYSIFRGPRRGLGSPTGIGGSHLLKKGNRLSQPVRPGSPGVQTSGRFCASV